MIFFYLNESDNGHHPLESDIIPDEDCKDTKDCLAHLITIMIINIIINIIMIKRVMYDFLIE